VAFNFRLNVQNVFRRLGIKSGARLPQLEDDVRMTMLLTDLSRLIPAPIEPRGMCGRNLIPMAGLHSTIQIHALSPGGIFIETVMLNTQANPANETFVMNVSTDDLALPVNVFNIDIGGTPIESIFHAGFVFDGSAGVAVPAPVGFATWGIPLGIFVPNQSFFKLRPGFTNRRLNVGVLYRELPSVEEVG